MFQIWSDMLKHHCGPFDVAWLSDVSCLCCDIFFYVFVQYIQFHKLTADKVNDRMSNVKAQHTT